MEEQEEILDLILGRKEEKDGKRKSTLQMALSVARYLCCYKTGQKYTWTSFQGDRYEGDDPHNPVWRPTSVESDAFVALLIYLICLEQLGNLFTDIPKKGMKSNSDNHGIKRIIKKYSEIKDDVKIESIIGLRNSLAHSFGLSGCTQGTSFKYKLAFNDIDKEIFILEKDSSDKSEDTSININFINLINEIENIIDKIQKDSTIELVKGIGETKTRYTIITD